LAVDFFGGEDLFAGRRIELVDFLAGRYQAFGVGVGFLRFDNLMESVFKRCAVFYRGYGRMRDG
jgi:hypothetical protein